MADTNAILMVVTSHDRIDDEHATGVWFEEFAIPYQRFCEQGYEVTVASPRGGAAPVDPRLVADGQCESVWPVHGSVLIEDGRVYFAAGRYSHLDGGIVCTVTDLDTTDLHGSAVLGDFKSTVLQFCKLAGLTPVDVAGKPDSQRL